MGFWKFLFTLKNKKPLFNRVRIRLTECCFGQNLTEDQTFAKLNTKLIR